MTGTQPRPKLDELRKLTRSTLAQWNVPGCAMGIIQDNSVLLAEGFGYRDIKNKQEVTPETLFPIASCTKSFTSFSAGLAVDEGLVEWDIPIQEYYPAFRMKDPCSTLKVTLRDLLTHRTGLSRHDAMWYQAGISREEIVTRLAYLEPARDFRSLYQYSNLMYMVAGFLVGHLAQSSWEEYIQAKILNPLGMNRTNFTSKSMLSYDDYAVAYAQVKGTLYPIPYCPVEPVCPAGGINSSLREMLLWVQLHLNQGKSGKSGIISPETLKEMHTPQVVQPEEPDFPEFTQPCYGMGWSIRSFRGIQVISHNGVIDGFTSQLTLVPQLKVGIIILNNLHVSPLPQVLSWSILDRFITENPADWNLRYQDKWNKKSMAKKDRDKLWEQEKVKGTKPSHKASDYSGIYENPGYGKLEIAMEGRRFKLNFHKIVFTLDHYHYDIFQMANHLYDMTYRVHFITGVKGQITEISIPFEPAGPPIIFTKMP